MDDDIYVKVVNRIRALLPRQSVPISADTEIHKELKIYGDVLFFDLIVWANKEFGVEIAISLGKYAPGEITFFRLTQFIKRALGVKDREYKSLTVLDIVRAIETGGQRFD
jgi:hypothetical protein